MARDPREIPEATLKLLLTPGVGPVTLEKLEQTLGSHEKIVNESTRRLAQIEGIGRAKAALIREGIDQADPERERSMMEERGVRLLLRGDDDYPPLLDVIPNPPRSSQAQGIPSDGCSGSRDLP